MTGFDIYGDLAPVDPEKWAKLREPFPADLIGHKPKGGTLIDFVGHAAVTDRLLQVDPGWSFTIDAEYPGAGEGFGIRGTMTILGVSRPEYGDGKNPKEAVSDFVKRGAMRFGVALDLWSKEELQASGESTDDGTGIHPATPTVVDKAGASQEGHSEPASPANVASEATAQPPAPTDERQDPTAYGEGAEGTEGTSEGAGAAPIFGPCKTCGGTEFKTIDTPRGKRQACGGCGRVAA